MSPAKVLVPQQKPIANAGKCRKMPENATKRRKMPHAAKRHKTPQMRIGKLPHHKKDNGGGGVNDGDSSR